MKVKKTNVTEYYHRGVVLRLVGFPPALPLDVEPMRPKEGEAKAARRLIERAVLRYGRFFDVIVGDAPSMDAGLFRFCKNHGKDVIAVLKGNNRALMADAEGVFSLVVPKVWREGRTEVTSWDAEGCATEAGILRVLHAEERVTVRERQQNRWVGKAEVHQWWWATTLSPSRISSHTLWQMGHRRWDTENDLFNTLATHWSLDHCFTHEPTAILTFVLTLFIAFVLLQSFYYGNIKPVRRMHLTLIGLAMELNLGVVTMTTRAVFIPP